MTTASSISLPVRALLMAVGYWVRWAPGASELEPQEAGRGQVEPSARNVFRPESIPHERLRSRFLGGMGGAPNAGAMGCPRHRRRACVSRPARVRAGGPRFTSRLVRHGRATVGERP
jgi:hypothetical protein